ncbi:hypothetical protein J27TS7_00950 [Paenibacillus dendritiformis]|nr:hypothetical protein J27TS7_00950 [Paenibacillus dendritiformis]
MIGAPVRLQVVAPYPTGHIVMALDNDRIHHATLLQPFLDDMKAPLNAFYDPLPANTQIPYSSCVKIAQY